MVWTDHANARSILQGQDGLGGDEHSKMADRNGGGKDGGAGQRGRFQVKWQ